MPELMQDDPARLDTAEFVADPHATFATLRAAGPAVRVVISGDIHAWLITRYEYARQAFTDPRMAKDVRHWRAYAAGEVPFTGDVAVAARRTIISTDQPDHSRLRAVLASAFTPRRVDGLRPRIEEITHGLIDQFAFHRSADLFTEFALPLPLTVICELFAVPEPDRASIQDWTGTLFHGAAPERMVEASTEIDNLLARVVEQRRAEPGDDFTSSLVRAHDHGRLSHPELIAMLRAMLAGGNETTVNLIGNSIAALLRHPHQLARLTAEPSRWPAAIEEVLRWDTPVQNVIWRFATADIQIGGVTIPEGDAIIIGVSAAGRDDRRYTDPERFDISRVEPGHLAFGRGPHHCIGAALARLEATVAVPALFARLPGLRLAIDPADLAYRRSTISRSLLALPVHFDPAGPPGPTPAPPVPHPSPVEETR